MRRPTGWNIWCRIVPGVAIGVRRHAHRPAWRIAGRETLRKLVVDLALAAAPLRFGGRDICNHGRSLRRSWLAGNRHAYVHGDTSKAFGSFAYHRITHGKTLLLVRPRHAAVDP
jgi:hypothetical protein